MSNYVERLIEMSEPKSKGWRYSDKPTCRTTPVETGKSWKTALRLNKEDRPKETEEDLYKKCILAMEAQSRFRKAERAANENVPQPIILTRWLNNGYWGLDIGSHSELKSKVAASKCRCGCEVHGPGFTVCTEHLTRNMDGSIIEKDPGSHPTVLDYMRQYHADHPDVKRCTTSKYANQILGKK